MRHLWGLTAGAQEWGLGVGSGWCLDEPGLMGSRQEFGLYPAAVGRLSAEKGGGLRKNPCGWALENDEDLHGLPGMQ